jgi:hypothetical protein
VTEPPAECPLIWCQCKTTKMGLCIGVASGSFVLLVAIVVFILRRRSENSVVSLDSWIQQENTMFALPPNATDGETFAFAPSSDAFEMNDQQYQQSVAGGGAGVTVNKFAADSMWDVDGNGAGENQQFQSAASASYEPGQQQGGGNYRASSTSHQQQSSLSAFDLQLL